MAPPELPEPTLLSAPLRAAGRLARRLDGWVNAVTGLGGMTTDRAAAARFETGCIPDSLVIDAIYQHDWLADRIVEKMPSIALVRGFTVEGVDAPDELVRDFEALNTSVRFPGGAFQKAVYDGRAYGCAGLFLGYRLGNPLDPVNESTGRGGIAFLDVVAQHELRAVTRYTDPSSPKFGMPEIYEILGTANGIPHPRRGQQFHESRLLRFLGKPLRTGNHPLGNYPELGVSVLTSVMADIARYGTSWAAVSHLLQDASIGVMKMGGLVEALASDDANIIQDRLSVLQRTKSLNRLMFLDADAGEEFSRVAVSFADLPGVMAQIILSISGAADMPAKILFGTSPMGLNANSAGMADLEQLYNSVDEYRRRIIGPSLETVLRAISGNAGVRVKFPALWQPSENEQSQTRLTNANATEAYYRMGAVQSKDIVEAARTGVQPETIGTPTEEPEPDPDGEGGGGPQGAPGSDLAGDIASEARRDDDLFAELRRAFENTDDEEAVARVLGWEEIDENELAEMLDERTDAAAKGGKKAASGAKGPQIQTGPRGGKFYISASGRKVYVRKKPTTETRKTSENPATLRKATTPKPKAVEREQTEKSTPKDRPKLNDLVRNPNINGELKESVADAMASGLAIGGFSKFYATRDMPTVDITSVQGPGFRRNELHGSALGFYNPKLNQLRLSSREDSLAKSAGKAKALPTGRQQDIRIFSDIATTPEKVAEITATHEFGHAVHMHGVFAYREERTIKYRYADDEARRVDEYVQQRHLNRGTARAVSRYGADDPKEWFAEAYAAYHHAPDWLKKRSPWLYETVGEVKRMRGLQ